ncbi:MAG: ABC transporter ATP-binding protein [Kiritimatiellaeota bacterium]|nr:ABC transporter ATP-binding protein [Kiritimatiellota bacterium]
MTETQLKNVAGAAEAGVPATPLIEVRDLKVWFPIRRGVVARTVGYVRAVDGVSLKIFRGETVGLVGESGCGKTTLGRSILRLEKAAAGTVCLEGRDLLALSERQLRPLRRRMQMVFQDPFSCLNPRMTAMTIVTEGLRQHNLLEGDRAEVAANLLSEVGLDSDALYRYPHEFSGGQRQRLSIARALSLHPDFIVCDEPVSALDVSVQAQVINLLLDLRARHGLSYLFISHDLSVVRLISHRVAVMYLGQIVETGPAADVIGAPLHPYTQALVSAIPVPGRKKKKRILLEGDLPSPVHPPPGCRFHTRCHRAMDICSRREPKLYAQRGRRVQCHLYESKLEAVED